MMARTARRLAALAVLLAVGAAAQAQTAALGRLFMSVEERQQLDQKRAGAEAAAAAFSPAAAVAPPSMPMADQQAAAEAAAARAGPGDGPVAGAGAPASSPSPSPASASAAAPTSGPESVQLSGVMRRSNGPATVWLNNIAQPETEPGRPGDSAVRLRLSSGRTLLMKPGQRFNPADGSVQESR